MPASLSYLLKSVVDLLPQYWLSRDVPHYVLLVTCLSDEVQKDVSAAVGKEYSY